MYIKYFYDSFTLLLVSKKLFKSNNRFVYFQISFKL